MPNPAAQSSPDVPPHAALLQMLTAKWVSVAISTVAKFGIADLLTDGPRTAQELAGLTSTHPDALARLLRATASIGIFEEDENGRFAQTPLSDPLRSDARPSVRGMAMMLLDEWHHSGWGQFPWVLETGRPALEKLYGKSSFEWLFEDPSRGENFNNAMTGLSAADAPLFAAAYDFSKARHIVDIGGGHGMLLAEILQGNPEVRGTLFEMPDVIEGARKAPHLKPFEDRCQLATGSFFEWIPEDADIYLMKHILHDWNDEDCGRILTKIHEAAKPGSKLLIAEWVLAPRNEPSFGKFVDLEMLVVAGGRERNEEEWRELLSTNGFRLERIIAVPNQQCLLEATPL